MKKIYLALLIALAPLAVSAQSVNVHLKDGTVIEYDASKFDYVDFTGVGPADTTITVGDKSYTIALRGAVDLGLSVKWAARNVGATNPWVSGDYFAWGETSPKTTYSDDTYTNATAIADYAQENGGDIAGSEYDAATVNLGDGWQTPNEVQAQELLDNCTLTWVENTYDSTILPANGMIVTGKNGNSIFLPAHGQMRNSSPFNDEFYASFWLSNFIGDTDYGTQAQILQLYSDGQWGSNGICSRGYPVRPVYIK